MNEAASALAAPYVGPRPFERSDHHLFFGREREAYEVSSLVLANKLFVLCAQSGAGKTSLVNAGVLPLVEDELEVLPTARLQVRVPRRLSDLTDVRTRRRDEPGELADITNIYTLATLSGCVSPRDLGKLKQTTLAEFLASRPRQAQPIGMPIPQLLIFDQFEELFTTHPDRWREREAFLKQIAEASDSLPDLRVLFILREDFLSRLLGFADLFANGLNDRYFLEPLRRSAAELAIANPIRNTGHSFERAAIDDLVRRLMTSRVDIGDSRIVQVEGEFVEPVLLQVVCQALWTALTAAVSTITLAHVRELADVDTSLARFYSDAVREAADLGLVTERRIRNWVQQKLLTHPGGTRGTVYMGANATEGLPNEVVSLLVGKLLRVEFRAGARWLEITHDSLLRPIEQSNLDFFRMATTAVTSEALARQANYLLGNADQLLGAGQLEEALAHCEKARRLFAQADNLLGEANTFATIGNIYGSMPDVDARKKAIEAYEQSADLFDQVSEEYSTVQVLQAEGQILFDIEEYERAVRVYSRALNHVPQSEATPLYAARGAALWYDDRLRQAADDFTTALEMDPDDVQSLADRAQVLTEIGQSEQALGDLDRIISTNVDSLTVAYALSARGYALANLGRVEDAMRSFTQSLSKAPGNAWTYWRRARVRARLGQVHRARRDARTALQKDDPGLTPKQRSQVENWLREQPDLP
jgi:tetratricopeptide (TPR) repeat protein